MERAKMARISVRRGSEGPRHDPYSYLEITFWPTSPRRKPVVYHSGLGEWVCHGRRRYEDRGERWCRKTESWVHRGAQSSQIFERLTGLSVGRAEKIPRILEERYFRTLSREEREEIIMCMEANARMRRWAE